MIAEPDVTVTADFTHKRPDAAVFKPCLKSTCRREQGLGNDEL